jgi:LmbE family N-acetylglucosaminyl deacetylase
VEIIVNVAKKKMEIDFLPEDWKNPQEILVILAHPDDPEFFCGGSIARWTKHGHKVSYCLLTCGDKGTKDRNISSEKLCAIRHAEQIKAANVLGVSKVRFLDFPDGYLIPNLELRKDITRVIREECPDILVTCDPQTLYIRDSYINHPDHRAAGQAVLDAVFPAARDHLNFIELWRDEGLEPHIVREVWVSLTLEPNVTIDVTEFWETKIMAINEHKSQIGDPDALEKRMRDRHTQDSTLKNPRYEEGFRRIIFSR